MLCNGLVETVGRVTYGAKSVKSFTAHPKLDPRTGERAVGFETRI